MCFVNDDCPVEGRREASGRRCTACDHVKASCSNCGNTYTYDSTEVVGMKSCPDCGRH